MQMGQGDASTVTMTFVGAISAEVSADIVGCACCGVAEYMSNFYVVVFTMFHKKHNQVGPVDLNCTGDFGNFALSTFQYYSPTLY